MLFYLIYPKYSYDFHDLYIAKFKYFILLIFHPSIIIFSFFMMCNYAMIISSYLKPNIFLKFNEDFEDLNLSISFYSLLNLKGSQILD